MLVRLDMILCVSSKVDRYQMGKDVFDIIRVLVVVLPMLLEGAQLVRMDVLPGCKDLLMDYIRGPLVHDMLRGALRVLVDTPGFTMFELKTSGVQSWVVLPCSPDGTPAYGGNAGASSGKIVFCDSTPAEEVVECVTSFAGGALRNGHLRIRADMMALTLFKAAGELPSLACYSRCIFVCDPAGGSLQFFDSN